MKNDGMDPVTAYEYPAPRDNPMSYPGKRPDYSFLLAEESVFPLVQDETSKKHRDSFPRLSVVRDRKGPFVDLNEALEELNVPGLGERYAVVGYGSNPVPGQLLSKFGKDAVVPVLLGELSNTEVVYNLISNMGYAFAEILINQPRVNTRIGFIFLDDEQLHIMMETEQNYKLGFCPSDITLESGYRISPAGDEPVYIFAGIRKIWVPGRFDRPVAVSELHSRGRRHEALLQEEVLALAIEEFELKDRNISTPEQLASRIRKESSLPEKSPKLKFYIQDAIDRDPRSLPSLSSIISLVDDKKALRHFTL